MNAFCKSSTQSYSWRTRLATCICEASEWAGDTGLIVLAAFCLLISSTPAKAEMYEFTATKYKPGHFAISVGIDIYTNEKLPKLNYAVKDAIRLSDVLRTQGFAVQTLRNFETNPKNLLARIVGIGEELDRTVGRENGTLILTYAGHGFQQDNQNYLAMGNADPDNLGATSLSMKQLKNVLLESGIGKKILLIDACRSNPARSVDDSDRVFLEEPLEASGLSVLFSSSPGEPSYEHGSIRQGVFSYFMAKGLEGKGTDANGWVTVDSLFNWVKGQITGFNLENGYPAQIPWRESANNGDIRITRPMKLGAEPASMPAENEKNNSSTRPSFWKIAVTVAGVIVAGIALSRASSNNDDASSGPAITVLIPTP